MYGCVTCCKRPRRDVFPLSNGPSCKKTGELNGQEHCQGEQCTVDGHNQQQAKQIKRVPRRMGFRWSTNKIRNSGAESLSARRPGRIVLQENKREQKKFNAKSDDQ